MRYNSVLPLRLQARQGQSLCLIFLYMFQAPEAQYLTQRGIQERAVVQEGSIWEEAGKSSNFMVIKAFP